MIAVLCSNNTAGLVPEILNYNHKAIVTDLQVTGEQRGSFGFGHHSDLLEGQEVVDVDVVLCRRKQIIDYENENECCGLCQYTERLQFQTKTNQRDLLNQEYTVYYIHRILGRETYLEDWQEFCTVRQRKAVERVRNLIKGGLNQMNPIRHSFLTEH